MVDIRHNSKLKAAAAIICAAAFAIYLFYLWGHDPATSPAPACLFRRLTGYDCPGCGTQRALYALLHGDAAAAWEHNAALFFALPAAGAYICARGRLRDVLQHPAALCGVGAAIAAWWIIRNL